MRGITSGLPGRKTGERDELAAQARQGERGGEPICYGAGTLRRDEHRGTMKLFQHITNDWSFNSQVFTKCKSTRTTLKIMICYFPFWWKHSKRPIVETSIYWKGSLAHTTASPYDNSAREAISPFIDEETDHQRGQGKSSGCHRNELLAGPRLNPGCFLLQNVLTLSVPILKKCI